MTPRGAEPVAAAVTRKRAAKCPVGAIVLLLWLAMLAGAQAGERMMPPFFLGREATVLWWPGVHSDEPEVLARFAAPGEYEVRIAADEGDGAAVLLRVLVWRGSSPERGYRECLPEDAAHLARQEAGAPVSFTGRFAQTRISPHEGEVAEIVTENGLVCRVPPAAMVPEEVRAARAGDRLRIHGTAGPGSTDAPVIRVDQLWFENPRAAGDEPPWTVRVFLEDSVLLQTGQPGLARARIPRAGSSDDAGVIGLRLRTFRATRLNVGGRPVLAELAVTSAERSYGLQGRSGLAQDHGMLFVFRRALRPRFVMKSVSFPLSIAFIRGDGVIADIRDMQPGDQWGVEPDVAVNYVLEMERGWFRRNNVAEGDTVSVAGGQDDR